MSLRTRLTLVVTAAAGLLLGVAAWAAGIVVENTIIDRAITTELVAFESELFFEEGEFFEGLIDEEADQIAGLARELNSRGELERVWEVFGFEQSGEPGSGLVVLSDLSVVQIMANGEAVQGAPPETDNGNLPGGVFVDDFTEVAFDVLSDGATRSTVPKIFIQTEAAPDGSIIVARGDNVDDFLLDPRLSPAVPPFPAEPALSNQVVLNSPIVANATDTASVVRVVMGITAAVLTAAIACAAWVLTGRALRPVGAIIGRVEDITGGTLHERVPEPGSGDEIDRLARTMNAMLGRLEHNDTQRRQFVSDASHELRSPVASIRTELEVALRYPETTEWPDVAENVQAENLRLETVISDLLALAQIDENAAPLSTEDVDLDEIVLTEAGRSRGVRIDTSAVSGGRVRGRGEDLAAVVRHLLDNAARHAATTVAVSVRSGPEDVTLIVDDDGAGIPAEDRSKVFARFTRLQEARDRDTGGAGLGLAVVRGLVQRHAGTVQIEDSPLGGARMCVRLPAPPAAV